MEPAQLGRLLQSEHFGGAALSGAMDPHLRPVSAPLLSPPLGIRQIDEGLADEEKFRTNGTVRSTLGSS